MLNLFLKNHINQEEEFNNEESIVDVEADQTEIIDDTSEDKESEEPLSGGFTDDYYRLLEKKRSTEIYIK
ncbi:hypothetical protein [Flammeovirga pacifica]|uniref:Uncharacterized protein n=1 Tax=Flammeovirga pacifica TaxID=915059 RepID=A0A1S1YVT0_FLAPC|nr:hypothetical protein [Flammeovirga pacifica]OHX65132.1 hypothetical protein NH26_01560 [Flammeovirga pacifica]